MFVAWRDLRFARGRFLLITAVVGLITVLVGFLSGLTGGLAWQNVSGLLSLHADRVVVASSSPGASPSLADSAVTAEQARAWADASGVRAVAPLGISQLRATTPDASAAVAVFGRAAGDADDPGSDAAAVLSTGAARALNAAAGDTVTVGGQSFRVARVGDDSWYSHTSIVDVTLTAWQRIAAATGATSPYATALLVSGSADWSTVDAASATTSTSLTGSLTGLPAFRSEIGSLLLIVGLLFGISALVVGAFFTVWTMQRRGDVAVLKALGATNGSLLRDALGQALVVLVVGTAVGIGITTTAGALASRALPFLLSPLTTLLPALLMIAVGLIGAAFSLRAVTSSAPLTALGSSR
ncbi:FtsX-like permease family protein [Microbacterium sp. SORGH_AS_0888]|uniref:FtsX-like permease family protein n=1 Tax=Microbacterium sp. SORGH_AS_0888 TaxID=3041791 RepID=UPI00278851A4|nr:ABC transporter permease [Microbacterium sp. SORGH_AS_0888]MDQ1128707.1 putative ABC transport system permease protein [Microbacterium sp. SORGH_AS_0888]